MCDPVTIGIALATAAASSKLQADGAEADSKAREAAQNKFYGDVDSQRAKASQNFQGSLDVAGKPKTDQRLQEAQAAREEAYQPSFNQNVLLPGQGNASGAVKTAITQSQGRGATNIGDAASRQAVIDAFGDSNLMRDIDMAQNAQRINTFGNFAQGAAPVLQADLAAAGNAGNKKRMMADVVSAIGTVAGFAAPGISSTGGTMRNVANTLGKGTAAPSLVNNPGIGIYTGKIGADPFASGLNKLRFNPSNLGGGFFG